MNWKQKGASEVWVLIGFILGIAPLAAWFTHVIYCINHHLWTFLVAGAIFFPIAIVHGFGIWFGFWV
jgi:hypothetical protein